MPSILICRVKLGYGSCKSGIRSGMHANGLQLEGDLLSQDCHHVIAGYILELISPLFPSAFLLLACLGSIARAITGDSHCTYR